MNVRGSSILLKDNLVNTKLKLFLSHQSFVLLCYISIIHFLVLQSMHKFVGFNAIRGAIGATE